jgi:hypothetical protein
MADPLVRARRCIFNNIQCPRFEDAPEIYPPKGSTAMVTKRRTHSVVPPTKIDEATGGAQGEIHYLAPGTINDDFVIRVRVLARGSRAVYEPRAVAFEQASDIVGFQRRVRIMAGNLQ